ncbi:hypothetical protein LSTR_LSTR012602 [Laodelphax striatellus]|uniref:Uncharacterized protein n=1 Tax=Laodelphax striatellus TaxID=195883 RepID=A0A482X0E2_LAOST|nr:hypothetical protein LSTR_LSTR012602 [Laodelphax striatellus]
MVGWFRPIRRDYALLCSAQHSCVLTNELFAVDSTTLLLQSYLSTGTEHISLMLVSLYLVVRLRISLFYVACLAERWANSQIDLAKRARWAAGSWGMSKRRCSKG